MFTKLVQHLYRNGFVYVLIVLSLLSWLEFQSFIIIVTLEEQSPRSTAAAKQLAKKIAQSNSKGANVIVLVRRGKDQQEFADTLKDALTNTGLNVSESIVAQGMPESLLKNKLQRLQPLLLITTWPHFVQINYLTSVKQSLP